MGGVPQVVTTFLHGMRDMRELVALVIKRCLSDLEFAFLAQKNML